jgi:hypothetical protein
MTSKSSCTDWPAYCEGVGSWASYSNNNNNNNNNNKPWEGKGTLPYTLACTVKSRPGSRRHQMAKREEEEEDEEKGGLPVLAIYIPCTGDRASLGRKYIINNTKSS